MNFDEYWQGLVQRVHRQQEQLTGAEEKVYRLTCIFGETMVDGIEAYFERRWEEFSRDQAALIDAGFPEVAADFDAARMVMFGERSLTYQLVEQVVDELLDDESTSAAPMRAALDEIYERLIAHAPRVGHYRFQL